MLIECPEDEYAAVCAPLRGIVEAAAQEYHAQFPNDPPLRVTAGKRTLHQQAELMAQMTPQQLAALYSNGGRPQYIDAILALKEHTVEGIYNALLNRTEGYVSRHLTGNAIDLGLRDVKHPDVLRQLIASAGARVLDESAHGLPCLHVSYLS
jgi:hypothetical protein